MIYLDLDGVIHQKKQLHEYEKENVFSSVDLIEGAIDFVSSLLKLGKVRVISKTFYHKDHPYTQQQKVDKINKCLELGFNKQQLIILSSNEPKEMFCCNKGDILIDDFGKNVLSWISAGGRAIQMFEYKEKAFPTAQNYAKCLEILNEML